MVNLVELVKGVPMTTTELVAKEFGIQHNEILKKISSFTGEIDPVRFNDMYRESTREVRGRHFKTFSLTRDGYMFIVMNISTKKAHEKKLLFIDAFNALETALLKEESNKKDSQWLKVRSQSKALRLQQTDVIKEFIDYAISQGSKNYDTYYKHYTNATYRALNLIQYKKPKLRDTLDTMEISQLMVAENVAKESIRKHMGEGEHYKVVYTLVKKDLEALGATLYLPKIG